MTTISLPIQNDALIANYSFSQSVSLNKAKTHVGLIQVNNSFSEQSYLPLSVAFLVSYAKKHVPNIDNFEFLLPVYKRISVDKVVQQLKNADLIAFSVYVWNFKISRLIAEALKKRNPNVTILFGGCHVPDDNRALEQFLRDLPYVDLACAGEGEIAFASLLNNYTSKDWTKVPSLAYLQNYNFIRNLSAPRIENLNDIPSPFLDGFFDPLIEAYPEEKWIGLWETNRGCPFQCFEENTKIITSRCPNKKAKEVVIGDYLMSLDEQTNEITETQVKEVFYHEVESLLEIAFEDGSNIKVTYEHPFYVNQKWVEASQLCVGDEIFDISPNEKISFNKKVNNPAKWADGFKTRFFEDGFQKNKKIKTIKTIEKKCNVVNYSCFPHENYFANYILSHNCTFCDWGVGAKKRMSSYETDRLFKEIDWFSKHKIEFVYCCDANFGMYKDKDLAITEKFVENKQKFGYPQAFSVQNTKNSTEASYNIQKIMTKNGLSRGVLLAFQSLHEPSLSAVKRANIKLETFYDLQRRFTSEGVETFSDIILGLPEETYETFTDGVSTLIEMGQHNRIQFNNLSILPNAEMGSVEYQEKYGMEIVETKMINIHGNLGEWVDDIYETQQLVVSNNVLSREDWVRCRSFAFMTSLIHFDKLFQIPSILLNVNYGIKYKELINAFLASSTPVLSYASQFFANKARDIQSGGAEYCESKEWLNIWWTADEYMFIKLVRENILNDFHKEALDLISQLLESHGKTFDKNMLQEAVSFNNQLIKIPFINDILEVELKYNIWDVYRANLIGENIQIEQGSYKYIIDRSVKSWNSWNDWYREVVWYGNKKGAYLYSLK